MWPSKDTNKKRGRSAGEIQTGLAAEPRANLRQLRSPRSMAAKTPRNTCHEMAPEELTPVREVGDIGSSDVHAGRLTSNELSDETVALSNQGGGLQVRIDISEFAGLNEAIERVGQAVSLTPDDHPKKAAWLGMLGTLHADRCKRLGELGDLDTAIKCQTQAVSLTPDGDSDKPETLNILGVLHFRRFERQGELADLDTAIEYQAHVVSLTPDGHPGKPGRLNNLGVSHQSRFERLGQLVDFDKSIECQTQAELLTPDGHPDKLARQNYLGFLLQNRFERLGQLVDLDMALNCRAQVVLLTPDSHPEKSAWLNNLGISQLCRFERLGQLADLDAAIDTGSRAVSLAPDGDPLRPRRLKSLGLSYLRRFERLGQLVDIDTAIECQAQAVSLTPDGDPEKPGRLNNLGVSHQHRFERLGQLADHETFIQCQTEAVSLIPDGHSLKPTVLTNLGNAHYTRFERLGQLADLERAIDCQAQAVSLTHDDHPEKPGLLRNLGNSYARRFLSLGQPDDLDHSISFYKHAAQSLAGSPVLKLQPSRLWAGLAFMRGGPSSLEGFQHTMTLIPQVVWVGTAFDQRYLDVASIQGLAIDAAAAALELQRYDLALEWLEEGMTIVWKQLLQTRTPLEDLFALDPTLAQQLDQVARDLDGAAYQTAGLPDKSTPALSLERAAQQHRRTAEEWERLVARVRLLPGMASFLRPKKASELVTAAQHAAVVVIIVLTTGCAALVVPQGRSDPAHISLPDFSHQKASDLHSQLRIALAAPESSGRGFKRALNPGTAGFENILATLWNDVAKPILDFLGYTRKLPTDDLPRITWCTTGLLSFLPLHAAGDYTKPDSALFDFAISTYTPTLSSLLSPTPNPDAFSGILTVGQAATKGLCPLPGTMAELDCVQGRAGDLPFTRLDGDKATSSVVLNEMERQSWVHLACHASQHLTEPIKSAFHLHDGPLDLAAITRKPLKHAQLAFLSACETATGDKELPEEAVHLTAGMLMAGYPTVIATMWRIQDSDAPVIADHFYGYMLGGGTPDSNRAAQSLHKAVGQLREQVGVAKFARWVPYVHFGN